MQASPYCPRCGTASAGASYCRSCGTRLDAGSSSGPIVPVTITHPASGRIGPEGALAPEPQGPPQRPGGVQFAGVLSIVLGSLGLVVAFFLFSIGAMFGAFSSVDEFGPFAFFGAAGSALFALFGLLWAGMGVLGIVAGAQGLKGAQWARWTMVALFGFGALTMLPAIAAIFPLIIAGLDVAAIVFLVNADATRWFEAQNRAS